MLSTVSYCQRDCSLHERQFTQVIGDVANLCLRVRTSALPFRQQALWMAALFLSCVRLSLVLNLVYCCFAGVNPTMGSFTEGMVLQDPALVLFWHCQTARFVATSLFQATSGVVAKRAEEAPPFLPSSCHDAPFFLLNFKRSHNYQKKIFLLENVPRKCKK